MPVVTLPTWPHPITGKELRIGTRAAGTIANVRTYQTGKIIVGGDPQNQKRVQLQYPYVYHEPVATDPRLVCRGKFRDGITAWNALPDPEKADWNALAELEYKKRSTRPGSFKPRTGHNLFMSWYILTP